MEFTYFSTTCPPAPYLHHTRRPRRTRHDLPSIFSDFRATFSDFAPTFCDFWARNFDFLRLFHPKSRFLLQKRGFPLPHSSNTQIPRTFRHYIRIKV